MPWRTAPAALGFVAAVGTLAFACTFDLRDPIEGPGGLGGGGSSTTSLVGGGGGGSGWVPVGPCTPGESVDVGPCGNCGRSVAACEGTGTWGEPGCQDQGACQPGEEQSRVCGNCGTMVSVCSESCTWEPWGACTGEGVCVPDTTRSQDCGDCGTQTSTCTSTCEWSPYGTCTGEGVCTPGTAVPSNCDSCSEKVCTNSCTWSVCQLKDGSECEGGTWQDCSPPVGGWQWCNGDNCQWYPCDEH